MEQKTYTFPSKEGKDVIKTLAPPVGQRVVRFLQVMGKSSFSEMLTAEGQVNYGIFLLDLAVNIDQLKSLLDACLVEGSEGIDFSILDQRISDGAIQDFFEQRALTLLARMRS